MKSRANKQTWKLAEHIYSKIIRPYTDFTDTWSRLDQYTKAYLYDKAKELTYMFTYNAFTGEDNHVD